MRFSSAPGRRRLWAWASWLAGVACLFSSALAAAPPAKAAEGKTAPLPDYTKASWIWDAKSALGEGTENVFFRKPIELPARPKSATILVTADNAYDLYVNGSLVGSDGGFDAVFWSSLEKYDLAPLLVAGKNVIAMRGNNMGGPAGLIAAARIELPDGSVREIVTDATWKVWPESQTSWGDVGHDDSAWKPAVVLGAYGIQPWGDKLSVGVVSPTHVGRGGGGTFTEAKENYPWPAAAVFVSGRVPQRSGTQSIWRLGATRAYLENDIPAPSMVGRQLCAVEPCKPDGKLRVVHDAGMGVLGSPSVAYDGKTVYFAMAPAGEKFFHVFRISADGSGLAALTKGTFHDYDPEPLPDGRIAFSSTRLGSREEYHGNVACSLFTMKADGSDIQPLTQHIATDREPRVTADGSIAFIRADNFLERAKVETHIHRVRPDGSGGVVLIGPDRTAIGYDRARAAEHDSAWLRNYGAGSPAPLPDGRVAAISNWGTVVSGLGASAPTRLRPALNVADLSPLPDGRLLATVSGQGAIGILDPATGEMVKAYAPNSYDIHSAVYLGPRPKPPAIASHLPAEPGPDATGFLLCQNVFLTRQRNADIARIKAIRVYEGRPFTLRSARHPYDHIGVEAVELGTVPLAPDGSFFVRVPADRALAMQAVDGEGRPVINEMSWVYVRPGETRTCVGCHYSRPAAPTLANPLAVRARPPALLGQGEAHHFRGNNAANGGVLNLQLDRFREAASINLYAQAASPKPLDEPLPPGRPAEVKRLSELLAQGAPAQRISSAQRLAILRDRAAVPALLRALEEGPSSLPRVSSPREGTGPREGASPREFAEEIRMHAALALAACGNRDAVPGLLKALEDPSPLAAQAANVALENLTGHSLGFNAFLAGPPPASNPSADNYSYMPTPALSMSREMGSEAWRGWLEQNDWPAIESVHVALLEHNDPVVVQKAIEALGHVGGADAKAALRSYLAKELAATPVGAVREPPLRALMAAERALGHLRDAEAIPLLAEILQSNIGQRPDKSPANPEFGWLQKPIYLAATAAEALGWIGTPEAEKALAESFPKLLDFWYYTLRTGDHSWLMGCHSSVVHYRMLEAFDAMGSREIRPLVPAILKSVPIDTDRGLLLVNDDYETVAARVVQRSGLTPAVMETCLAVLGDASAKLAPELKQGVTASPPAVSVGGLSAEARAAQILSAVALDGRYAERLRAVFDAWRAKPPGRERSWACFFMARALGKMRERSSADSLVAALDQDATEGSFGYEDPPNVFIWKAMTPFYRAAAAYALGELGDPKAVPTLLEAVANFDNAMDTRHAAARALGRIADRDSLPELRKLAADYPDFATRRVLLDACERLSPSNGPKVTAANAPK